ncbi:hypothetical protein ACVWZW_007674 [Bradyrhizobium sp. F1.13.4]
MDSRGAEVDGIGVGRAGCDLPAKHLLRIAFRRANLVGLVLQVAGETVLRGLELPKRHVLLADQIASAIALPRPPAIFGEGKPRRGRIKLADQAEDMAVQLGLGKRQRRVRTDQRARGGVGGETVEIRIAYDRCALIGHLEKTRLHPVEIVGADRCLADDAATEVALADPDRVLLDPRQAIGQAGKPRLDSCAQLLGGGGKLGITAEQLIAGIADLLAVVPGEQRQPVGDGAIGRAGLREAWSRRRGQQRKHSQHDEPHSSRPRIAAAMLASRIALWNGFVGKRTLCW